MAKKAYLCSIPITTIMTPRHLTTTAFLLLLLLTGEATDGHTATMTAQQHVPTRRQPYAQQKGFPPSYQASGTVLDEQGRPVEGMEIRLRSACIDLDLVRMRKSRRAAGHPLTTAEMMSIYYPADIEHKGMTVSNKEGKYSIQVTGPYGAQDLIVIISDPKDYYRPDTIIGCNEQLRRLDGGEYWIWATEHDFVVKRYRRE